MPNSPARRWLASTEFALLIALLVAVGLTILLDSSRNYLVRPVPSLIDIARQTSYLGIFALGAAVVIIAGGIDLSVGSMIAFSGTIFGALLTLLAPGEMARYEDVPGWCLALGIAGTLSVALLVGSLHAWLITVVRLPPFVATLASLVGLRSLARAICGNLTGVSQIAVYDRTFRYLANSVWIPILVFLLLAVAIWVLLSRTVVGRHIYAHGGNAEAARLSGIRTDRIQWIAYSIGSVTAAIAGLLYVADQGVADPQTLGVGYELNAIAAAVVGGASLQGGVGTVWGTVLGALFLRTVMDGIAKIIKTGADVYEGLIVGSVVVIAVASSHFRSAIRQKRELFPGALGIASALALSLFLGVVGWLLATAGAGLGVAISMFVLAMVSRQLARRRRLR